MKAGDPGVHGVWAILETRQGGGGGGWVCCSYALQKHPSQLKTTTKYPSPLHLISFLLHIPLLTPTNLPLPFIASQSPAWIRKKAVDHHFFAGNTLK